jgi:hypothetical protein
MSYYALSMHVYESDYANVRDVIASAPTAQTNPVPVMPGDPSPQGQIRELVKVEVEVRHAAAGFSVQNFESKWLPFADCRLHSYWRQFYYLLLFAMCQRVGFISGASRLREFIDEPWLSLLPQEAVAPRGTESVAQPDLFPLETKPIAKHSRPILLPADRNGLKIERADSTVISRADLEQELKHVLELYQPHVAQEQWRLVVEYEPVFMQRATTSPIKLAKVFRRLQDLRVSLKDGEKVEAHRAKADPIIRRLEELTAD